MPWVRADFGTPPRLTPGPIARPHRPAGALAGSAPASIGRGATAGFAQSCRHSAPRSRAKRFARWRMRTRPHLRLSGGVGEEVFLWNGLRLPRKAAFRGDDQRRSVADLLQSSPAKNFARTRRCKSCLVTIPSGSGRARPEPLDTQGIGFLGKVRARSTSVRQNPSLEGPCPGKKIKRPPLRTLRVGDAAPPQGAL